MPMPCPCAATVTAQAATVAPSAWALNMALGLSASCLQPKQALETHNPEPESVAHVCMSLRDYHKPKTL